MDKHDYEMSKAQEKLYGYAAERGYDMAKFSDFFLRSEYCAREFDLPYAEFKARSAEESMERVLAEAEDILTAGECEKPDDLGVENAGFVGMIYRMLYIITPYTSRELSEKVQYSEVWQRFTCTLHETEDYIAEDICNALGLEYYADRVKLMI